MSRLGSRVTFGTTIAVTLLALLAGCTEQPPASRKDSVDGVGNVSLEDPNAIPIVGQVVNEEILPMAAVDVTLSPGDQFTTTDETGGFAFGVLEAGTYTLGVVRVGYEELVQEVVVRGPTEGIQLVLKATPDGIPYHETQIFTSYMMCNYPPGGGCIKANTILSTSYVPEDQPDFQYEIAYDGLKEMRFEAKWNNDSTIGPTGFTARNPGALFISCNSSTAGYEDTQIYYTGPGGEKTWQPSRMWIRAGTVNQEEGGCHEYVGTKGWQVWQTVRPDPKDIPTISLQYRANVFLTFFYWALSEDRNFTVLDEA